MHHHTCPYCGMDISIANTYCGNAPCKKAHLRMQARERDKRRMERIAADQISDEHMRVPQALRRAREKLGLSRDQLADQLGYTSGTRQAIIYNWERGERPVPRLKMARLAEVLGLDLDDIHQPQPGASPLPIGEIIRTRRMALGMTQRELGERLGYDGKSGEVFVGRWESGTRPVPRTHIKALASMLGILLEDFLP